MNEIHVAMRDRKVAVRIPKSGGQNRDRKRDKAHGKAWRRELPAFVFNCPGSIWNALVWNCKRNGESPAVAMRAALETYLAQRGWKETPPPTITVGNAEEAATLAPEKLTAPPIMAGM